MSKSKRRCVNITGYIKMKKDDTISEGSALKTSRRVRVECSGVS